ncbi:MAG: hypothetical protein M3380_00880 [Chloroflexota bacterium]|nr:hypothetical protein [Chloroflexota bacterium]
MNTQQLSIAEQTIGDSRVTFIGVEHDASPNSYPWREIQKHIEGLGEAGQIVLEYFSPELEQTIYNHPVFGGYAKRYSNRAGITPFFDGIAAIAAKLQKEIIVLDPANNAAFQLLYLHVPLLGAGLGVSLGCLEALQRIKDTALWGEKILASGIRDISTRQGKQKTGARLLRRLAAGTLVLTGLEGVSWFLQDHLHTHSLRQLYRDRSLNMRDMRWVTIAQGLTQYCRSHAGNFAVFYPPAHIADGILHYLTHSNQRMNKYGFYSRVVPGISRTIRAYRFERGQWRLVQVEPITTNG